MLQNLQNMALHWLPFLEQNLWLFHKTYHDKKCLVYGTGYESWGVWAHLNANLLLATTLEWDDSLFKNAPTCFQTKEKRLETSLSMFYYALGYHTTGVFDGAGGTRWGGELKEGSTKEGYNNWHSPLWAAFLAEVYFLLEEYLDQNIKKEFENAIIVDANVQISLDISNFDGEAEEKTKISHPESNAWKACLLLLARLIQPRNPNAVRWRILEDRLWISSFAKPSDINNEETINGLRIKDLVIGNHITETNNIVHHGFLHPCYMIFPLLTRLQAKRFCEHYKASIPITSQFREEDIFKQLKSFILNGRVIYPAGKDWPRWVYGQNYILPILLYRQYYNQENNTSQIESLIATRKKDIEHSNDHSFVIHRFGQLLNTSAWEAHRFESDCAASLAQSLLIVQQHQASFSKKENKIFEHELSYEPLAKTIYLRREKALFAVSARSYSGPAQITMVHERDPHLLEWRANANPIVKRLHGIGAQRKDVIENSCFKICSKDSFVAKYQLLHGKESYKQASFQTSVVAGVLPNQDTMLIWQKIQTLCYTATSLIKMHVWRFAQSPHNNWQRTITWQDGQQLIKHGEILHLEVNSPSINIDNQIYLTLPNGQKDTTWVMEQNADMHEDVTGITWFEVYVGIPVNPTERLVPAKTIAENAIIASFTPIPKNTQIEFKDDSANFLLSQKETWSLTTEPTLAKLI